MKLLVIGIDGASFRFLNRFLEAGVMPNLARLMERGRYGTLTSTIPPSTAPAWVTCFSGVNPGRHGVFNFVDAVDLGKVRPVSSRDVKVPRLWHMLNGVGWKVHVLDVPMTFPPENIDGVMVSDWMTSGQRRARTTPVQVQAELKAIADRSRTGAIADGLSVTTAFLRHLEASVDQKSRLDALVVARYPADAVMTVYQHIDVLCHYFWHLVDPTHPAFVPRVARRLGPAIRAVVAAVDRGLGSLVDSAASDALVAVVSDHGFSGVRMRVHLNDVLRKWGVLSLADSPLRMVWLKRGGINPAGVIALARKLDAGGVFRRWVPFHLARGVFQKLESAGRKFDRRATKAWFPHGLAPGIVVLEQQDGEKEALIGELVRRLKALRTPDGLPCFDLVTRREAVYHGPVSALAPDIVLQAAEGVVLTAELEGGEGFSRPLPGQVSGFHRPEGVFVFCGPSVEGKGPSEALSLEDVVPSILDAFGAGGNLILDGSPAPWIKSGSMGTLGSAVTTPTRQKGEGEGTLFRFDEDESAEIARRLEALGYM